MDCRAFEEVSLLLLKSNLIVPSLWSDPAFKQERVIGENVERQYSFDRSVSKVLENAYQKRGFETFSEENRDERKSLGANSLVVIDPVDGSENCFRGSPLWTISVGLCDAGVPKTGFVLCPGLKFLFLGSEYFEINHSALGWTVLGSNIRLDDAGKKSSKLIIATGYPVSTKGDDVEIYLKRLRPITHKVRMLGSASLSILGVVLGWFDVYFEERIRLVDVAGALGIATRFGLSVWHEKLSSESGGLCRVIVARRRDVAVLAMKKIGWHHLCR